MSQGCRQFLRILTCALLIAQTDTAAAQPAAPAPQQTTATFDDWIVRCETQHGPPPQTTCAMLQFTQLKGQQGVLTQIAIGRPAKGQPIKLVIQAPIGVWLPAGVKLASDNEGVGVLATFKRCVPTACFADVDIKNDTIKKFRVTTEAGKLQFKNTIQKDVVVAVSFKGFGAAYDALLKE